MASVSPGSVVRLRENYTLVLDETIAVPHFSTVTVTLLESFEQNPAFFTRAVFVKDALTPPVADGVIIIPTTGANQSGLYHNIANYVTGGIQYWFLLLQNSSTVDVDAVCKVYRIAGLE